MGATVEFSKWEGITFDTKRRRIYTAMSEIREGMEDFADKGEPSNEFDLGDTNDVRLAHNPCGCVYVMDVDADYMAVNMYELICGTTETGTDEFNECNIDGIAGPDNVAYVSGHDGLIIGARSHLHGTGHAFVLYFCCTTAQASTQRAFPSMSLRSIGDPLCLLASTRCCSTPAPGPKSCVVHAYGS